MCGFLKGGWTTDAVVTSWGKTQESQPGFSHEEIQHDGTAQSIVNEAISRASPDDPMSQFIIGNDETEIELLVDS